MMWVDECWKPLGWTRFSEQWGLRISFQTLRGRHMAARRHAN